VDRGNPAYVHCPEPYRPRFLDEARLREFSRDPATDMPPAFLEAARDARHGGHGFLRGGLPAGHGAYPAGPNRRTRPDPPVRLAAGCRPYRFRVEKTLNTGSHATALSR